MQRFFYRNLAFLIAVNLVVKPVWLFGIDRTVQNVVSAEQYGLYFVLMNLSMLTMILLDLGISSFNNKAVAGNTGLLTAHVPHLLTVKLVLALVYFAVTVTAALLLDYSHRAVMMLLWISANQVMAGFILFLRSNINALHRFFADSVFSVLDKTLVIVLCSFLLLVPAWRSRFVIEWFVYAQSAAYLITVLAAFVYLKRLGAPLRLQWPDRFTRELLQQAVPFAVLIFLMTLYGRIDAVMLKQLLGESGKTAAGIYAAAFRILDALNQVGYMFSILLLPVFSRMLASSRPVHDLIRSSSVLLFLYAVTAAAGISVYSHEITGLLYRDHIQESSQALRLLVLALVGYSLSYVFSTLLTAGNLLWHLVGIAAAASLLNVLLNLALIPRMQAGGAAAAAAITVLAAAGAQAWLAFRTFSLPLSWPLILRLLLYAACCWLLFVWLHQMPLPFIPALLAGGLLCLAWAWLLGLLRINELMRWPGAA
ncbi:MAG: oligosaccharide flippase family protein [Chitinophagales bacterium]|nr:oligosaccharide flippase family protein [Chitinophagales bacterium]MDW8393621.1 oligosaccharide flippase family protein [Chitinophagales bacterium]